MEETSHVLDLHQTRTDHDILIHVDAALEGCVISFTHVGAGFEWSEGATTSVEMSQVDYFKNWEFPRTTATIAVTWPP